MHNRRNFYRLLHVQHDAPAAVIKTSYRTLMQTLRHHPDLGGDDWNAQLLNEAMATLGDPVARADYDRTLGTVLPTRLGRGAPIDPPLANGRAAATSGCLFCGAAIASAGSIDRRYASTPRCVRCGGPTRSPATGLDVLDSEERRQVDRQVHAAAASLRCRWPEDLRLAAALLDFSVTGCTLECTESVAVGERVLLAASVLTAIGVVRHAARVRRPVRWRVGLEFLTLEMHASPGQVFSASA